MRQKFLNKEKNKMSHLVLGLVPLTEFPQTLISHS